MQSLTSMTWYPRRQFTILRVGLGFFLLASFLIEFPDRLAFYGKPGVLPLSSLYDLMPPFLARLYENVWSNDLTTALYVVCIVLSLLVLSGFYRRPACLLLFFLQAALLNRNMGTVTPERAYINWLVLACAAIPSDVGAKKKTWFMPASLYRGAWAVLTISYFYTACTKLESVRWRQGSAMGDFLKNDRAWRPAFQEWAGLIPNSLALALTYSVLVLEISGPFVIFTSLGRKLWWSSSLAFHLAVLIFFPITQISLGMILFHFFLFDPRWFAKGSVFTI